VTVKTKKTQSSDLSTARHLPFSQIKENIIFMKDDSARVIMKCSTINFLLKNTEEQDSIIVSFQRNCSFCSKFLSIVFKNFVNFLSINFVNCF
jgi:hypothetical protein